MRTTLAPEMTALQWRKSSDSNSDGGECLEVADGFAAVVPVRDSKTAPHGPVVVIGGSAWTAFVDFSCNGTPDDLLARHKLIYQDVPLRHSPGLDLRLAAQTQRCWT
ncbi:DUF397 domain-containing protein [Streptomyces sp. NPDC005151]